MIVILDLSHVRITYPIGDVLDIGLKETLINILKHSYQVREFQAVEDVSFHLERGDLLGIIGRNGAGKSTLAKAITGIVRPISGTITRNGTVTALLELSAGFDNDLTVRENVMLRAAMMGYTRSYAESMYLEIIEFAGLEEFQDRCFKQLSSGMKSRLGFSIASLINPEILILDEVLSVGDGAFKEKSEKRMKEIISGGATTILISHSLTQIESMCTKVLWLERGKQIEFTDDIHGVCERYQSFLGKRKK